MTRCTKVIVTLAGVLLGHLMSDRMTRAETPPTSLVQAVDGFGFDAYRSLRTYAGSFVFSPASLYVCTAMAGIGSRGQTAQELATALKLRDWDEMIDAGLPPLLQRLRQPDRKSLAVDQRLFCQRGLGLLPAYVQRLERSFGAQVAYVDFRSSREAAGEIDRWLAGGGWNSPLAGQVVSETSTLMFANVVRAKAAWRRPFPKEATKPAPFHALGGDIVLPMMYDTRYCPWARTAEFQAIELTAGDRLSLVLVLPPPDATLAELESRLDVAFLEKVVSSLRTRRVNIRVPRFSVETALDAGQLLKQSFGVRQAFAPRLADFSGITGAPDVMLGNILSAAAISVNEEAAEARAATLAEAIPAGREEEQEFHADRPFLFVLRQSMNIESGLGLVLFAGRFAPPGNNL